MRPLIAIALVGALAAPVSAQSRGTIGKRVDGHLTRGVEFYAQKQYELAIIEFRAGFALDPRPDFLFALAQAERLSGDCPSAVVYYKRFLTTNPGTNQAEAARVNMRRCTRALESGPRGNKVNATTPDALKSAEQASEPAPSPIAPPPVVVPTATTAQAPPPWYSDRLSLVLLGGAATSVVVGGGFWLAKSNAESAAASATDDADYASAISRARRNRTISLVGFGVGVSLGAAATYRLMRHRREGRQGTTVVAAPTRGGAAIAVSGRF